MCFSRSRTSSPSGSQIISWFDMSTSKTMNYEPWTMNYEPWTMNHELWTMNYELWLVKG
jgi:hypothetical protein